MPFRPDRLKGLREAKGFSQEELGRKAGLSHSVIAKSESGKNMPRSDALDKLALALDCTIDYLHGRGYEDENPAAAAVVMAFDVAREFLTEEQKQKCQRVLRHAQAPKTAQAWRSFAEMVELAVGLASTTRPLSLVQRRPRSKPIGVPSKPHR